MHGTGEIKEKGDTIFSVDNDAEEIKRWTIEQKAEAEAELAKHRCTYRKMKTFVGNTIIQANEWALMFCEYDKDGDYITGADYELAEIESPFESVGAK